MTRQPVVTSKELHTLRTVKPRALIVAMPTTPGVPGRLAKVTAEAAKVAADRMPGSVLLTEPDIADGDPNGTAELLPTKANVLAYLPGCSIAHFACHGESDPTGPSRSLLLLHDHNSDPLTVASLAPIRLGQAQRAFLSACHAMSIRVSALLDEAVHLASVFQLAGFPCVIGTRAYAIARCCVDHRTARRRTSSHWSMASPSCGRGPGIPDMSPIGAEPSLGAGR